MNILSAAVFLVVFTVFSGNYGNFGINFGAAELQNVTFISVKYVEGFSGYIAPSDYIKETMLTGNDRVVCAAECVKMTGCLSFFLETNTSLCQFHSTIISDTAWLTSSPSSFYFKVGSGCPETWYTFQDSCYFVDTNIVLSFDNAKAHCQQIGGYLLRIDSAEENNYIKEVISTTNVQTSFWFGLRDISQSNTWVWEATGQAPTFTDWDIGQPQTNNEHCAFLYSRGSKWHDGSCNSVLHVICEIQ